jgi:hypothetical protein
VAPPSAGGFFAGGLLGMQGRTGSTPPSPPVAANVTPANDNGAAEGE